MIRDWCNREIRTIITPALINVLNMDVHCLQQHRFLIVLYPSPPADSQLLSSDRSLRPKIRKRHGPDRVYKVHFHRRLQHGDVV